LTKNREDATVFVWRHDGSQEFDNKNSDVIREGIGFSVYKGNSNVTAEYARGKGMIILQPLFAEDSIRAKVCGLFTTRRRACPKRVYYPQSVSRICPRAGSARSAG